MWQDGCNIVGGKKGEIMESGIIGDGGVTMGTVWTGDVKLHMRSERLLGMDFVLDRLLDGSYCGEFLRCGSKYVGEDLRYLFGLRWVEDPDGESGMDVVMFVSRISFDVGPIKRVYGDSMRWYGLVQLRKMREVSRDDLMSDMSSVV